MKKQIKKTVREKEVERIFKGSEVMVLIEDFNNKIGLLADGQQAIREDLGEFKEEMRVFKENTEIGIASLRSEMHSFKGEMHSFKGEMYIFRDEMYGFKRDTESNFKFLREYLSRIEDELMEIKAELVIRKKFETETSDWMKEMEKRVIKLEAQLQQRKVLIAR